MHEARDEWYQLIALSLYDLFFLALISNIWIVKNEEVSPASKNNDIWILFLYK